jgi:hypothetical protein
MDDDAGAMMLDSLMIQIDNHIFQLMQNSFRPYFVHVGLP